MDDEKFIMFKNRLVKVYRHFSKQARRQAITCYRIYDRDLPEFPFSIDIYENYVYLAEFQRKFQMADAQHEEWLEQSINLICEIVEIPVENFFIKQRKRKPGRLGQYQKVAEEQEFFVVNEAGLKFKVNLSDYLDTGLFLDHRITRSLVREISSGKRVLNLFCYTGSFSVYAAAGNAKSVTSVDLSKTYLLWAEENMRLNNLLDPEKHFYIHDDVMQYIRTLPPDSFDLVILDPPTFSNSKRMEGWLDIQKDQAELVNETLRALSPGGIIFFSTNYNRFVLDKEKIKPKAVKDITKATTPFDFAGKFSHWCYKLEK